MIVSGDGELQQAVAGQGGRGDRRPVGGVQGTGGEGAPERTAGAAALQQHQGEGAIERV